MNKYILLRSSAPNGTNMLYLGTYSADTPIEAVEKYLDEASEKDERKWNDDNYKSTVVEAEEVIHFYER